MAKSKRTGKSHVSGYAKYKNNRIETINRTKKLNRLLKEQPNNEQLKVAINSISHRRKPPATKMWNSTTIKLATIMKKFTGKFSRDIFSNDVETCNAGYKARKGNKFKNFIVPVVKSSMFSIKERARWN